MAFYRVLYKKWSEMKNNFMLVEETYEAHTFYVSDGNLVLEVDGVNIKAIPMTFWADIEMVEREPDQPSKLVT